MKREALHELLVTREVNRVAPPHLSDDAPNEGRHLADHPVVVVRAGLSQRHENLSEVCPLAGRVVLSQRSQAGIDDFLVMGEVPLVLAWDNRICREKDPLSYAPPEDERMTKELLRRIGNVERGVALAHLVDEGKGRLDIVPSHEGAQRELFLGERPKAAAQVVRADIGAQGPNEHRVPDPRVDRQPDAVPTACRHLQPPLPYEAREVFLDRRPTHEQGLGETSHGNVIRREHQRQNDTILCGHLVSRPAGGEEPCERRPVRHLDVAARQLHETACARVDLRLDRRQLRAKRLLRHATQVGQLGKVDSVMVREIAQHKAM